MVVMATAPRSIALDIHVSVKTVTDDAVSGRLVKLSPADGIVLRAAKDQIRHIAFADVVRVTTERDRESPVSRDFTITLTGGDVLRGDVVGGDAETIAIDTLDLGNVRLPLESIVRIDAARARQAAYRASVEWLDRVPGGRDQDRILLTNGDVLRGFILVADADGIAIESTFGETKVPYRAVVAVRLAAPRPFRPDPPYQIITFVSSGRLTVTEIDWSADVLRARLRGDRRVSIEAERIVSVDLVGGRWEWLSQHEPISFQHTPMLSYGWGYAMDHNVLDGPMVVSGRTFARGIGVHTRSSLTFDLKGAYTEFVTFFGMDDDSGSLADATARILIDGKPVFEQANVRRGTLRGPVRLNVAKAKRIELIADFGENGDVQDRFNWIEPALIR